MGPRDRGGVRSTLRRLGAVQLDTISVLARSHELVAYARLGAVGRRAVEDAYWGSPPRAFEYWAHAACLLPIEDWPWFSFRRGRVRSPRRANDDALREVRRRLDEGGPLTARDLGGARNGGPWWDWSPVKRALEELLALGEVVCVERRAWQRVYDLADRAIPAPLLAARPTREECLRHLVAKAVAALGVATEADIADYYRLRRDEVVRALRDNGLVPVAVEGWDRPAWAHPGAFEALASRRASGRSRTTLLSPFDSLVWFRPRAERLFGFAHRLEAYVPRHKRVHGYFAMPLLAGGRLVGRVDPGRSGTTLVARQLTVRRGAIPAMARALGEAAGWVGCSTVRLERVDPPENRALLEAELRRAEGA